MFASGIFIDSFCPNPKLGGESTLINAIKAFQADIVIVLDDKYLEINLKNKISEMNQ